MPPAPLPPSAPRPLRPAGLLTCLLTASAAAATPQFWNVDGSGGDGIWGTGPADQNWNTAVGAAGPNIAWPVAGDAVATFQDAIGGTVTVFGEVTAAGIRQNGAGYQIDGGIIRLENGAAAGLPEIVVESGALSLASALAGNDGLRKSGAGTLTLSGLNSFTGAVELGGGTLVLAGPAQLPDSAALSLSGGTTLVLSAGQETVGSLVSSGGTVAGSGVLTAATYRLEDGSIVSGNLGHGAVTSRGGVSISGSIGTGTLVIETGTLSLTGSSSAAQVRIDAGATLVHEGSLADGAELQNAGTLTLNLDETVGSYVSDGGSLGGSALLSATSYQLNDGSSVTGALGAGVLTTTGTVQLGGTAMATTVDVGAGRLVLLGAERLSDLATVTLGGTLELGGAETIGALVVNGGRVAGPGLLTAATYQLNDGSEVDGRLGSGWLATAGNVLIRGSALGGLIQVTGGILTNEGTLGTDGSQIDIAAGARLIAAGIQRFALLTTSGSGTAVWQGDLANPTTVAPGGNAAAGTLRIEGDFANSPAGTLSLDVGPAGADFIQVTGGAQYGGRLDLRKWGAGEIEAMVPVQLIGAGTYTGNFDSLTEDLAGEIIFNPANGSITRLDLGNGGSFLTAATANQASVWAALYDDVVDPGTANVRYRADRFPPYQVTGGIASDEVPSLLWALNASITPGGLDAGLLNRLSPEVYLSLTDHAIQATRQHRRTAWSAPALAAAPSGSKDAKSAMAAAPPRAWEIFAAADWFDGETSGSLHQADYQLSGVGMIAGARVAVTDRLRLAAYLAGDQGEIRGALINADGSGISTGLLGEWRIDPAGSLRATGGIAYGTHRFDGSRGSATATAAGWSPGFAAFSDVDADALDLHLGIDAVAWRSGGFQLMPSMSLNYTSASADAFRESGATPLVVDGTHRDSFVAGIALASRMEISSQLAIDGEFGFNLDLRDDTERVSARFAAGNRALAATGSPLADDLAFLGLGATWMAREDIGIRLGYRAEFRSDAEVLNSLGISSAFRF
jgi:autotransporter-associated beta strand protein